MEDRDLRVVKKIKRIVDYPSKYDDISIGNLIYYSRNLVSDSSTEWVVKLLIPCATKNELSVTILEDINENNLLIKYTPVGYKYEYEILNIPFQHQILIPSEINLDSFTSSYKNGLLKISATFSPNKVEKKSKVIDIQYT